MKLKHTNGEWIYQEQSGRVKNLGVYSIENRKEKRLIHIAEITNHPQRPDEMDANAKLIAAAPDLLNACVESLKYVCIGEPAYKLLQNAIKKATE